MAVTLEDSVLTRLAAQGGRSGGSIALELGVGDRQVQRILKRLQHDGLVAHNGMQGRGSRWYLVEEPNEDWQGRADCLGAWAETALVQGAGEVYEALKGAEVKLRRLLRSANYVPRNSNTPISTSDRARAKLLGGSRGGGASWARR